MDDSLKMIIDYLGEPNENIDEESYDSITDEIDSLDPTSRFELSKFIIIMGKPQILAYIMDNYNFKKDQIRILSEEAEKYYINQIKKLDVYNNKIRSSKKKGTKKRINYEDSDSDTSDEDFDYDYERDEINNIKNEFDELIDYGDHKKKHGK